MQFLEWSGGNCPLSNQHHKKQQKDETRIVKTKLTYCRHTHINEFHTNPELIKIKMQGKGVSHHTRLENLCIILADNNVNDTFTELPSN